MESESGRLRADAQRNRDQIVHVARLAFAEVGPGVPMDEIARRAGVGVGTLYRRFPDRSALQQAVALETLTTFLADARTVLAEEAVAWDALVRIVNRAVGLRLGTQLTSMDKPSRHAVLGAPAFMQARSEAIGIIEELVVRAQEEGSMRTDVGPGDVFAVVSLLLKPPPSPSEAMSDLLARRCLTLVLDGLAAEGRHALPGRPVSAVDLSLPG
ncbi:TetR/AcrR family transcriptional regulator [Phycicoccus sp. CSK15P-2]|uniref:TetR/AcrR family transcriptional regulator n=1 Tax=Phycicoccus sp. CSK15P-2 TaxID=2807627 RepID=UPI00194DE02A|nr:TetR/AcrR family transcriptional regulator [Phycicoccus sp. CSK15P-2]MBM6402921.1 TetR/AcrR family transcriptional regulator [Phycicoccus sp. CSK15P-2]